MIRTPDVPRELVEDLRRARRLAYWTLAWMLVVVAVIGLTMGSSRAMRTAWIEDLLSLVPAIVFLISLHYEACPPTPRFAYGFLRMNSVAFVVSAMALTSMGAFLVVDAVGTLVRREHVTIETVYVFGNAVWMGWLMIAALLFSVIPPVLLARRKLPLARRLQDKVLHTDAMMQKADWMTGLAGSAGVLGVGLGLWWADAVAAGLIAASILNDGIGALRSSSAELIDGAPRSLESSEIADDATAVREALLHRFPGADVKTRETGRFIRAQVSGVEPPPSLDLRRTWPGDPERHWRLAAVSFVPPNEHGADEAAPAHERRREPE